MAASDTPQQRFALDLQNVERYRQRNDYGTANRTLCEAVQRFLRTKIPFSIGATSWGFSVTMNGHVLAAVAVSVHKPVRSMTELGDPQEREIAEKLASLRTTAARTQILVVTNQEIKASILERFAGRLDGVEIWTTADLERIPFPIRG